MNELTWSVKAVKQLNKLQAKEQTAIKLGVMNLKRFPDVKNVKSLKNFTCGYRLRIGRYRVFFDFDGALKIVDIIEVRKRDENTY
jgi:mRNA-degrading endonuclease RelE of RelBE toxin-antitoxin system